MRYLQDQLIAYIGNKRTLLPFLQRVFSQYAGAAAGLRFYDPFAGAGAVSRLAKTMGYQVHCNDWEEYSYVINSCWLGVDQCDLDLIFQKRGGVEAVFNELQSVGEHGKPVQPYISRHYAPKRTATADYRRERLFYTRENAEFIDAVRTQIDEWYPDGELEAGDIRAKHILLGSLLYEAATHANTSGVFKAFHKGFGGHGGDALGRIMAPMQLEIPVLHDSLPGVRHVVTRMDAARAAGEGSYDLVYLDPPYNCHQYGSNYFMLNTIARWDRPAVDNSFAPDGRLAQKAGIRKDWTDTRSPFCSRSLASQALAGLLDTLDSRFIMMSYNTDGIISFEEQMDLFASRGKVSYTATEYAAYRGGRQSMSRRTATTEYLLIIDTKSHTTSRDRQGIESSRRLQYLKSLQSQRFVPSRMHEVFNLTEDQGISEITDETTGFRAQFIGGFIPCRWEVGSTDIPDEQVESLVSRLERCLCRNQFEQFGSAMDVLETVELKSSRRSMVEKEAIKALKRFTHRKYYKEYESAIMRILDVVRNRPDLRRLTRETAGVQAIAALRFAG